MKDGETYDAAESELSELIEQRATLQKWLVALEGQRATASEHIIARVRADYVSRLAATTEALSTHLDGIQAQLDRAIEKVSVAQREREEAADALEEGRLRRAIGEMSVKEWD